MNRKELQAIARVRLLEAEALLDGGHFSGAYYLCGYAVECGLKACIAKTFRQHEVPDKDVVNRFYTHALDQLVGLAGLKSDLDTLLKTDRDFEVNWAVVKDWGPPSRYAQYSETTARDLLKAVANRRHG